MTLKSTAQGAVALASLGLLPMSAYAHDTITDDIALSAEGYMQTSDVDRGVGISDGEPIIGFAVTGQHSSGVFGAIDSKSRQSSTSDQGLETRLAAGYRYQANADLGLDVSASNTWLTGPGPTSDFTEFTVGATYATSTWQLRTEGIFDFSEPNNTLQGEWTYAPSFRWFGFVGAGYAAYSEAREDRLFGNAGVGRRWDEFDLSLAYHVSSLSEDDLTGAETDTDDLILRLRARF